MPSRRKIDSPAGGRGSPAVVSQASGADTGAADAAHSLPNPRAGAHDSEASTIAFWFFGQPALDPSLGAGAFVADASDTGRPDSPGAGSLLELLAPSQLYGLDFAPWFPHLFDSSSPCARGWFYPSILFVAFWRSS